MIVAGRPLNGSGIVFHPSGGAGCAARYSTQAACDGDPGCAWCLSGAVPPACNTLADAKGLPPSVFKCDKVL